MRKGIGKCPAASKTVFKSFSPRWKKLENTIKPFQNREKFSLSCNRWFGAWKRIIQPPVRIAKEYEL